MNIIVAMSRNRVIGKDKKLLWHIPEDLKNFKKLTTGNTVIMGRKTFESIGKPLPNRQNIVISRSMKPKAGVDICPTMEKALAKAESYGKEVFVIGGGEIYKQTLPFAHRIYVSYVKETYEGDTFFPPFDEKEWMIIEQQQFKDFEYLVYEREEKPHGGEVMDLM